MTFRGSHFENINWLPFVNLSGEPMPAFSAFVESGAEFKGNVLRIKATKPSTAPAPLVRVSGPEEVPHGGMGRCFPGPLAIVKYASGAPANGQAWGPTPGEWTVTQTATRPASMTVVDVIDATNKLLLVSLTRPETLLRRATLNENIAGGAVGTITLTGSGAEVSATNQTNINLLSGDRCSAYEEGGSWFFVGARSTGSGGGGEGNLEIVVDELASDLSASDVSAFFTGAGEVVNNTGDWGQDGDVAVLAHNTDTEEYWILEINTRAEVIEFVLTADIEASPQWEGPATVTHYYRGYDPGSSVTVYDRRQLFPHALTGAKGIAEWDNEDQKYILIQINQRALRLKATLPSALVSTDASKSISTFAAMSPSPFDQVPTGSFSAYNTYKLAAASGSACIVDWNEADSKYEITQVIHAAQTVLTDWDYNDPNCQVKTRAMSGMFDGAESSFTTRETAGNCT